MSKVAAGLRALVGRLESATFQRLMRDDLARIIDHTLLAPGATSQDLRRLCKEAIEYRFGAVCVNSAHVALCASALGDTDVDVVATVGFPLGDVSESAKVTETYGAVVDGAEEIDMVLRIGALRDGEDEIVRRDIAAVVNAAQGNLVKVILETSLLTDEQKRRAAKLCVDAGASFVKTSTGFGPGGATVQDVQLLRQVVGHQVGVKASGGIRDTATADAMVAAGADRLGTSRSVAIVAGGATLDQVVS